jgi:hypothetical protein
MTTTLSINELNYSNSTYTINISIFSPDKTIGKNSFKLNNSNNINILLSSVEELVIGSSLTSPTLSGYIIFKTQGINVYQKLFKEFYVYLNLIIHENIINYKSNTIEHQFIVTNIKILKTDDNFITYKLDLISVNTLKANSNIYISTNGQPESIDFIMEKAFTAADLPLVPISRDKSSTINSCSPNKIIYTSTANDTLNTILPYLQKNLLDPTLLSDINNNPDTFNINALTLITYTYDPYINKYSLLNLNAICNSINLKNDNIKLIQVPINKNLLFNGISDVEFYQIQSIDKLTAIKNLSSYFKYNFNYTLNTFNKTSIDFNNKQYILDRSFLDNSTEINKYYLSKYENINSTNSLGGTYYNYPGESILNFDKYYSNSSSNVSIYKDLINLFLGLDTIFIKLPANLTYHPGEVVHINIFEKTAPPDANNTNNNGRLQLMNGIYIITENRFVFEYNKNTNLPMFRNYIYLNRPINRRVN